MKKYVIERDIPGIGSLDVQGLSKGAGRSNAVLRELGKDIQWLESFVAADKLFCIYLAKNEELIWKHAELSGFPATRVIQVGKVIDPSTERTE